MFVDVLMLNVKKPVNLKQNWLKGLVVRSQNLKGISRTHVLEKASLSEIVGNLGAKRRPVKALLPSWLLGASMTDCQFSSVWISKFYTFDK